MVYSFLSGHGSKFLNYNLFLSLMIVFIFANCTGPDEMPPYAAFHLCLHCLPKYLFTGMQNERVNICSNKVSHRKIFFSKMLPSCSDFCLNICGT